MQEYGTQQSRVPAGTIGALIFLMLLSFFSDGAAWAAVTKQLHIEWSYDTSQSGLAGYRIYQDGVMIREILQPSLTAADLNADFVSDQASFTMTAVDDAGNESPHSAPYTVTLSQPVPLQAILQADTLGGEVPLTVNFDGTSSLPDNGSITTYSWDFGDGEVATGSTAAHIYTTAGSYTVTLTVHDTQGATASVTSTINATAPAPLPNQAPTAVISADVTSGTAPLTVSFDGSGSSDSDGSIVSYSWNFANQGTANGANAGYQFTVPGQYKVTLTVTDDQGATASSEQLISVAADQVSGYPVTKQLHIEWSYDTSTPDLAGYRIYQDGVMIREISQPSIQAVDFNAQFNGPSANFTMTAIDTAGNESPHSAPYVVNILPAVTLQAGVTADKTSGETPLTVHFDGSSSLPADGTIVGYDWDFGDGATATGVTASHTFTGAGSHTVQLTIRDGQGQSDTATIGIHTTTPPNQPPTAVISTDILAGTAPLTVSFDGSGSSDSDGSIVSYSWNFADGTSGSGATVRHQFTTAGAYQVELTVTDDRQAVQTSAVTISVSPAQQANEPPVADFTADPVGGAAPHTVHFDGSGSADPDGTIALYFWNFGDGTTANGITASHTYTVAGIYTAKLYVTDDQGEISSSATTITVSQPQQQVSYAGTVTVNGAPLPGLEVRVLNAAGATVARMAVDDTGAYASEPLPVAEYVLKAVYGAAEKVLTPGSSEDWTLTLYGLSGAITGLPADSDTPVLISAYSAKQKLYRSEKLLVPGNASYRLANLLPADDYIVSAVTLNQPVLYYDAVGTVTAAQPVSCAKGDAAGIDFNFAAGGSATVAGTISRNGAPLAGVAVYAYEVKSEKMQFSISDADGRYQATLGAGQYVFFVRQGAKLFLYGVAGSVQYLDQADQVTVVAGDRLTGIDIDLVDCSFTLSGQIMGAGQQPTAGALVTARGGKNYASALSDATGFYRMDNICADSYVVAMDLRQEEYPIQSAVVQVQDRNVSLDFTVDTGFVLSGKIKNKVDRVGIGGVTVSLYDAATGVLFGGKSFHTGSDGSYTIRNVQPGSYLMRLSHPDYQPKQIGPLAISADKRRNVNLIPGSTISGVVRDGGGNPLAGVLIGAAAAGQPPVYTMSDGDGGYLVPGLQPTAAYTVVARKGNMALLHPDPVTPGADGAVVDLTLTTPARTVAIVGTVLDGCNQQPVADARVIAATAGETSAQIFYKTATTGQSGEFTVTELPASVSYDVVVTPQATSRPTIFTLDDDGSSNLLGDFVIPCGSTLSGTVNPAVPAASAYIVLFDANDTFVDYQKLTAVDGNGAFPFTFSKLAAGGYKLVVNATGNATTWFGGADRATAELVQAGTSGLAITMAPAAGQ